jgi:copper chaperone CopZ
MIGHRGAFTHRRGVVAALGLAALCCAATAHASGGETAPAAPVRAPLTRVRFQLRAECNCASCGFALQDRLRKLPGITRVELSPRERIVALTFDEARVSLSRVAAVLTTCELGKHSALIGDLADTGPAPEPAALAHTAGVRAVEVEPKKQRLLIELADGASTTTAELTAALAKAGVAVRFDAPAAVVSARH